MLLYGLVIAGGAVLAWADVDLNGGGVGGVVDFVYVEQVVVFGGAKKLVQAVLVELFLGFVAEC